MPAYGPASCGPLISCRFGGTVRGRPGRRRGAARRRAGGYWTAGQRPGGYCASDRRHGSCRRLPALYRARENGARLLPGAVSAGVPPPEFRRREWCCLLATRYRASNWQHSMVPPPDRWHGIPRDWVQRPSAGRYLRGTVASNRRCGCGSPRGRASWSIRLGTRDAGRGHSPDTAVRAVPEQRSFGQPQC